MKALLFMAAALGLLISCTGYELEGKKPTKLAKVERIYVPLAQNRTLFPKAEVTTTNSAVDALTQDGTYHIASQNNADAVLYLTLAKIDYTQARSSREDTLRSEELEMTITVDWKLTSGDGRKLLEQGAARGHTRLFARGNLQTARAGALPDALKRASQTIASRLADGF